MLDKNERVLSPQQNSDLTGYLKQQKSNKSNVTPININFHIRTNDSQSFNNSLAENRQTIEGIVIDAFNRSGLSSGIN